MRLIFALCALAWMLLSAPSTHAQLPTSHEPVGLEQAPWGRWKTVDDATGKVRSVVLIWEDNGTLFGRIEKLLDFDPHNSDVRCEHCEGPMKDKPLVGMRILWNLRRSGNQWSGGEILDPDSGRTYRCSVELLDDGKKLKVRGFIGVSLFGRTQYWLRDQ